MPAERMTQNLPEFGSRHPGSGYSRRGSACTSLATEHLSTVCVLAVDATFVGRVFHWWPVNAARDPARATPFARKEHSPATAGGAGGPRTRSALLLHRPLASRIAWSLPRAQSVVTDRAKRLLRWDRRLDVEWPAPVLKPPRRAIISHERAMTARRPPGIQSTHTANRSRVRVDKRVGLSPSR